jgi:hypothetical protein
MTPLKKLLKFFVGTIAGLIALTIVVAILINFAGVWISGGGDQFSAAMTSAAPYLLLWRILIYVVGGAFLLSAYRSYQAKGDATSMSRLKKIAIFGVVLIVFIEVPKFLTKFITG